MNYIVDELFSLGNALKDHGKIPGTDVTFLEAKGQHQIQVYHLFRDRGLTFHSPREEHSCALSDSNILFTLLSQVQLSIPSHPTC